MRILQSPSTWFDDVGSGGEEDQDYIFRQDFSETPYWNAEIVTDDNGDAKITFSLPDSLTNWMIDVRGLTADTRVGQASEEIVTTKKLLVRPLTPRFLAAGDHTELSAIVHNYTEDDLQVDISLQGAGFVLDDPRTATQDLLIPSGGLVRSTWWGTVEDVPSLDLVFSATGGGYNDSVRPMSGNLPVLRFIAPQSFNTAGVLDLEGERLEIISIPRTFDPTGGTLEVELSPSLAAAVRSSLHTLEFYPYQCTEQTLSRFLPNLMAFRAIQNLGLESPELLARLERTLDTGIQELGSHQNWDGGWSWWGNNQRELSESTATVDSSDGYITAYVVFGLSKAREAGIFVDDGVIQNGVNYLLASMPALEMLSSTWQLDRLAFRYFALAQAGNGSVGSSLNLYDIRDQLSPYAKALLRDSHRNRHLLER